MCGTIPLLGPHSPALKRPRYCHLRLPVGCELGCGARNIGPPGPNAYLYGASQPYTLRLVILFKAATRPETALIIWCYSADSDPMRRTKSIQITIRWERKGGVATTHQCDCNGLVDGKFTRTTSAICRCPLESRISVKTSTRIWLLVLDHPSFKVEYVTCKGLVVLFS